MKNVYALFPCSPLKGIKQVDEDFLSEFDAATKAKFQTLLFDHDLLVKTGQVKFNVPVPAKSRIVLRGWMLSLGRYETLYNACGGQLITSPEEYENKHYWPKAYEKYELLRKLSPRCFWTTGPAFSVAQVKQFFGGYPIMVKDHVKSAKGAKNAMFIKNSKDKNEVFEVVNNMIKERGPLFERGVVFKEWLELDKDSEGNICEFRVFFHDGRVLYVESRHDKKRWHLLPVEGLENIGSELGDGFYCVDAVRTPSKQWKVLECGDGQVSSVVADLGEFYKKLLSSIKRHDPEEPKEYPLDDKHAVHPDYLYVADGKVVRSDISGTVADLRRDLRSLGKSADVIMNCDIFVRRKLLEEADGSA